MNIYYVKDAEFKPTGKHRVYGEYENGGNEGTLLIIRNIIIVTEKNFGDFPSIGVDNLVNQKIVGV